ncbi:MAG: VPLPA-CTERM sorting domain-containing protein [Gammaproteobacteria bacterium]|nr:VPLPA-CTERM sorting domain-containing protein [Gammaproteobacteria bacterium]
MKFWNMTLISTVLILSANVNAAIINETDVVSDFSADFNATTLMNTFGLGITSVVGDIGSTGDTRDIFTFEISAGTTLRSLTITYNTSVTNGFSSFELHRGNYATFDIVEFINLNEFYSGIDLLQFDSAPGPQSAGFYTMHIIEVNDEFSNYQIDFEVISAVPVPAAVWLFGSGLISLAGFARRKKT